MRSFALWYNATNPNATKKEKEVEVHINLWDKSICGGARDDIQIDFGLLVSDIEGIDEIDLYCPFSIDKSAITDLGQKILNHPELVNAIFNENYHTSSGAPRRLEVISPSDKKERNEKERNEKERNDGNKIDDRTDSSRRKTPFLIYQLEIENEVSIDRIPNHTGPTNEDDDNSFGSLIKIKINKLLEGNQEERTPTQKYYFRFRIETTTDKMELFCQRPHNISPFSEAFVTTEVIDFRLNNLRSCCSGVQDRISQGKKFKITSVHYLILRLTSDTLIQQGDTVSSRLLEQNIWKEYIPSLTENIIAYHFKKKSDEKDINSAGVKEFVILTRFEYQKTNKWLLGTYLYMLIYMSVLSNALSNWMSGSPVFGNWIAVILFLIATAVCMYLIKDTFSNTGNK